MSNADNVKRFSVGLDRWANKGKDKARLKFISICLEADAMLKDKSPVDTGFFRSMWSVLIGVNPVLPIQNRPSGFNLGGGAGDTGTVAALASAQLSDMVWIVNPTSYGMALENGHSKQAPQGMVGVTAAELRLKYGL